MNRFIPSSRNNLLPYDGEVYYLEKILDDNSAQKYFRDLQTSIPWEQDEINIFGKKILTKRKVAWFGDKPYLYTYSNATKKALPWTKELMGLKNSVEEKTDSSFNTCLLNLYHFGEEGMGWHSDDEPELGQQPVIAALSLGAERKFYFKHKISKKSISIILEPGSLLLMKGNTQANWLHRLPPTKKVTRPRISLTFRTIFSKIEKG
ncbi:alpha-ketoglutarate-dependent dioxygenase AlkB [Echinicola jeungdonensis]|uniref:Alpha-ketoglutarate-dependent dioxygenase AlkB n=1 Tax=Echinicola jeungdonensis TaxID=709343 RepID=A0ABV5J3K1_9BACT|nr:alpha-ketoglutarate-dependent dioxygenase AlkB [Echinicola jeungdonensis]MDN3671048.1 alpha-ketoglutarate-dependent dioxygenase AlkB [Echinicola jeungdonensis]